MNLSFQMIYNTCICTVHRNGVAKEGRFYPEVCDVLPPGHKNAKRLNKKVCCPS